MREGGGGTGGAAEGRGVMVDRWAAALREALLTVLTEEDVDITAGAEAGVLEVSTDDWTLHIERLAEDRAPSTLDPRPSTAVPTAWLAVDDEPEDPARHRATRRALMSPAVDRALARADAELGGALRSALVAGGDPFTQDLVEGMSGLGGGGTPAVG